MIKRNKDGKTVVVLGVGRSGTSVTAGILNIMGVALGESKSADETNPRGYFEDLEISGLIREILISAGGDDTNLPSHKKIMAQKEKFGKRIEGLIFDKTRKNILWGWKVPGTSLTIDLFLPYLRNPYFVMVLRNPLAVVNSLIKRRRIVRKETLSFIDAFNLMNQNNQEILNFLAGNPRLPQIFLSYESLVKDPVSESRKLADFLGLDFTNDYAKEINKFVIPKSRISLEKKLSFVKTKYILKFLKLPKKLIRYFAPK